MSQRIIFLSPYDPRDVSKWSGTIHYIYTALIGNKGDFAVIPMSGGALDFCARVLNKLLKFVGVNLDCRFSTLFALLAGGILTTKLVFISADTLVAVASSNLVPYILTRKKIIYISDGTFRLISESYPAFRAFPKWLQRQGDQNEAKSLRKARYVIYPSRWAAELAHCHYGVPKARIRELPFGPNIPERVLGESFSSKSIELFGEVKILFVSADWRRKNGDKALQICQLLIAAGANVRLITVGDFPKYAKQLSFVCDKGFLRKSDPVQLTDLCAAYREAHFFLLPSEADASPIVLSEAQAFGIPPVTCDVGGISSSIVHGQTGLLLPAGAQAEAFAGEIIRYLKNPELYSELSVRCRGWYVKNANWQNWSNLILELSHES